MFNSLQVKRDHGSKAMLILKRPHAWRQAETTPSSLGPGDNAGINSRLSLMAFMKYMELRHTVAIHSHKKQPKSSAHTESHTEAHKSHELYQYAGLPRQGLTHVGSWNEYKPVCILDDGCVCKKHAKHHASCQHRVSLKTCKGIYI